MTDTRAEIFKFKVPLQFLGDRKPCEALEICVVQYLPLSSFETK